MATWNLLVLYDKEKHFLYCKIIYASVSNRSWVRTNQKASITQLVNKIREMVSFKPSKEIEKDVFHLVTSDGQRKNSESP